MIVPIPGFRLLGGILIGTGVAIGAESLKERSNENQRVRPKDSPIEFMPPFYVSF